MHLIYCFSLSEPSFAHNPNPILSALHTPLSHDLEKHFSNFKLEIPTVRFQDPYSSGIYMKTPLPPPQTPTFCPLWKQLINFISQRCFVSLRISVWLVFLWVSPFVSTFWRLVQK